MFHNVLIIGLGLLGGSLARTIRQRRMAENIYGYDISEGVMKKAFDVGLITHRVERLEDSIIEADLVIICTHLSTYRDMGKIISRYPKAGALITDVGSVKAPLESLSSFLSSEQRKVFVSSHPIAGSENSGFNASSANLFDKKKVIITPLENSTPRAVQAITKLWENIGCTTEIMSAEAHDAEFAFLSHVPQFLSFCFADFLKTKGQVITKPAANFKKFTRLAGSSPVLWQDIFLANNKNISKVLADFYLNFNNMIREIKEEQKPELVERFTHSIGKRCSLRDLEGYQECAVTPNYDIEVMIPRIITSAFLEVTGDIKNAGPGFLDFTRIIVSDPLKNAEYILANKEKIVPLLEAFHDSLDNFYKIVERNTKPDIFNKMSESKRNFQETVKEF